MDKIAYTDAKRPEILRMGGKALREGAVGRTAHAKACKAEIARRKANAATAKASK